MKIENLKPAEYNIQNFINIVSKIRYQQRLKYKLAFSICGIYVLSEMIFSKSNRNHNTPLQNFCEEYITVEPGIGPISSP